MFSFYQSDGGTRREYYIVTESVHSILYSALGNAMSQEDRYAACPDHNLEVKRRMMSYFAGGSAYYSCRFVTYFVMNDITDEEGNVLVRSGYASVRDKLDGYWKHARRRTL